MARGGKRALQNKASATKLREKRQKAKASPGKSARPHEHCHEFSNVVHRPAGAGSPVDRGALALAVTESGKSVG